MQAVLDLWRDAGADQAHADWHRALTEALQPYNVGSYIGGSRTVERPEIVPQAFTPEKRQTLCALRDRHDPDRGGFDHCGGLIGGS